MMKSDDSFLVIACNILNLAANLLRIIQNRAFFPCLLCNLLLYLLLSKIKYLNQNTPFLIFISSLIFGALHFTGF